MVRNAVDEPERRGAYAAVISIIALVDVPICFMITRMIPSSLHPVVVREGGMAPDMAITLVVVMVGMICLGYGLYRFRFRTARLAERVQALKDTLEERAYDVY